MRKIANFLLTAALIGSMTLLPLPVLGAETAAPSTDDALEDSISSGGAWGMSGAKDEMSGAASDAELPAAGETLSQDITEAVEGPSGTGQPQEQGGAPGEQPQEQETPQTAAQPDGTNGGLDGQAGEEAGSQSSPTGGPSETSTEGIRAEEVPGEKTPIDAEFVPIDEINFPDLAFQQWVLDKWDEDKDGKLSWDERNRIIDIDSLTDDPDGGLPPEIENLSGIEYFTSLVYLDCQDAHITSIDFSKISQVRDLNLARTGIISVDGITQLVDLEGLDVSGTGISGQLDVSALVKLQRLYCFDTAITELHIEDLTDLESLGCYNTAIQSLDVRGSKQLHDLRCENNPNLKDLKVSGLAELTVLSCYDTPISVLDVSDLTKLEHLNCGNTNIDVLDVSNLKNLVSLYCENTAIKVLDVGDLTKLQTLCCPVTEVETLDVSKLTELTILSCYDTPISVLDVSGLTKLENLNCERTGISTLDVSNLRNLVQLDCSVTDLKTLDVSNLVNLQHLACSSTNIDVLDVSKLENLEELFCDDTAVTVLDVGDLTQLVILTLQETNVSELDASRLSQLQDIYYGWKLLALRLPAGRELANTWTEADDRLQKIEITLPWGESRYDLREKAPHIEAARIEDLSGARLDGTTLSNLRSDSVVTYSYDCGNGYRMPVQITFSMEGGSNFPGGGATGGIFPGGGATGGEFPGGGHHGRGPHRDVSVVQKQEGGKTLTQLSATTDTTVESGAVHAQIGEELTSNLLSAIQSENADQIVIDAKSQDDGQVPDGVTAVELQIPGQIISAATDADLQQLLAETDFGTVALDAKALKTVGKAAKGSDVSLRLDQTSASTEQQSYAVEILQSDQAVASLGTGRMAVTVPIAEELTGKDLVCESTSGTQGKTTYLQTTRNDDGMLTFQTFKPGTCVVREMTAADRASDAKVQKGVDRTDLSAKSKRTSKGIRVNWEKSKGYRVDYYEVFRSTKKNSGYGLVPLYQTDDGSKTYFNNTANLKEGVRYYYKVRGVRVLASGELVYTEADKAYRTYR